MSEWQTIETAPKDGTVILGWFDGEAVIIHYVAGEGDFPWANGGLSTCGEYHKDFITHWMRMPLPPPPEVSP